MKKNKTIKSLQMYIIIVIVYQIMINNCFGQTFRKGFDNYDWGGNDNGQGYSFYMNTYYGGSHALSSSESKELEDYLTMFRATNDQKYLNQFIIHSKRVQTHRDDNTNNNLQGLPPFPCTHVTHTLNDTRPT